MARYHGIATLCFFLMLFVAPARAQVLPMTPTPTIAPPAQQEMSCGSQARACPNHHPETSTVLTLSREVAERGDNCCAIAKASCAEQLRYQVEKFTPKPRCPWCFAGGCKPTLTWQDKWWKLSNYELYGFGNPPDQPRVITSCDKPIKGDWGTVTCKATCKLDPNFLNDHSNCPTIGCLSCSAPKTESSAAEEAF